MSERIHICMSYSPILWTTLENAECETYMYIFIIWNCSWDSSIDGNSTSSADITASFSKFVSQLKSMKQWTNSLLLDIMQLNLITKATIKTKERSHDKEEAVMGYSIVKSVFKPHGPFQLTLILVFCSLLGRKPVHHTVTSQQFIRLPQQFAITHLYSWVERHWEQENDAMTQPGLKPRPLNPDASSLTIRQLCLPDQ